MEGGDEPEGDRLNIVHVVDRCGAKVQFGMAAGRKAAAGKQAV